MSVVNNAKVKKRELTWDLDFIAVVEDQAPAKLEKDLEENKSNDGEWLVYFCKTCRNILEKTEELRARKWKKTITGCPNCKVSVVAWSKKSIQNYYKVSN